MQNCQLRIANCKLQIGAVLALALLTGGARAEDVKPAAITVPFEILKSKHMAVQVMINGKGPYRLIFDTGAPFILINTKTARDSGMLKDVKKPLFALFNSMGPAKVKKLELGGIKVEDTTAAVMDHPTVELMAKALGPIEGLVGFPFFARYKMTIDYQAKTMLLAPNGFHVDDSDADPNVLSRKMLEGTRPAKVLAPAAQWGFLPEKEKGDEADGVVVKAAYAGGAAAAAGLRPGDRLLTLDGRWTDSVADAYFAAGHVKPGAAVKLVVLREGKEVTLTVTPRPGL
jgi:aspartyl protease/PDZ domain-containing protein